MSKMEQIVATVKEAGLQFRGDIVQNPTSEESYFVPILMGLTKRGRRNPSGKTLAEVKKKLLEVGLQIEFILISDHKKRVEEGLRHSLMSSFPDLVRNAFLSGADLSPQAWLETKGPVDKKASQALELHLREFAKLFSLGAIKLNLLDEARTPTRTEMLVLIRHLAPAKADLIQAKLLDRKFEIPSADWLTRSLDALRKARLVVRSASGDYSLTLDSLRRLGTAKGRRSHDVVRLLALARGQR